MKNNRYTKDELAAVVAECVSFAEVARRFGKSPVGGNTTNLKRLCMRHNIDITHMTGQAHMRGQRANNKLTPHERLVMGNGPTDHRIQGFKLRDALIEAGVEYKCNVCGMDPVWNGKPITLEVDHIDEQYWNNTKENLQFICSNCHTQKTEEVHKK